MHKASLVYKMQGDRRQIEKNRICHEQTSDSRHQHHQNTTLRRLMFYYKHDQTFTISTTKTGTAGVPGERVSRCVSVVSLNIT